MEQAANAKDEKVYDEAELELLRNEYYEKGRVDAKTDFIQMLEDEKKKSFEEGYLNGRNEAIEELNPKYLAMKSIFDEWDEKKTQFLKDIELEAAELALCIERKIVGFEIQKNKEALKYVIREAMAMIRNRKKLRIRAASDDEEYFRQGVNGFLRTFGENIEIVIDPNVEQGGCIIETNMGDVDANVETRWKMIADTFFSGIKRGDNDIFRNMFEKTGENEPDTICGKSDEDSGAVS